MTYYSVRLTPRPGVTTDMTNYTRQLNDRLRVVNKNVVALHHVLDNTLQTIVETVYRQTMRHAVASVTVLKDDQPYATVDQFGWQLASAPSTLDPSKIILLEG